jgi:hypothetical protein
MISSREFSQILPGLLFLGVCIGVIFGIIIDGVGLAITGLKIAGLPLLIASVIIKVLYKNQKKEIITIHWLSSNKINKLFILIALITCIHLILVPGRGYIYVGLVTILFLVALTDPLFSKHSNPKSSILQTSILLLILSYSLTLRVPMFFGSTDVLPHMQYSAYTSETGAIIPETVSNYAHFPLFHIFYSIFLDISPFSLETSYFILSGLIFAFTPFLIFCIAREITGDDRLSSLSTIVYGSLPFVVHYNSYFVTRTLFYIGMLVFFVIMFRMRKFTDRRYGVLLLFVVPFLLLSHQVSFIQMLVILSVFGVCGLLVNGSTPTIRPVHFALLTITFFGYWIYVSQDLLTRIVTSHILGGGTTAQATGVDTVVIGIHVVEMIHNSVYVILLLVGAAIALRQDNRLAKAGILVIVFVPILIYSPLDIFERLSRFRHDRMRLMLAPFAAIMIALAIRELVSKSTTIPKNTTIVSILVLCSVFFGLGITGGFYHDATADSPDIEWTGPPQHFTEEEVKAMEFTQMTREDSEVAADRRSAEYLESLVTSDLDSSKSHNNVTEITDPYEINSNYIIYHEHRHNQYGLHFSTGTGSYLFAGHIPFDEKNEIYTNGNSAIIHG